MNRKSINQPNYSIFNPQNPKYTNPSPSSFTITSSLRSLLSFLILLSIFSVQFDNKTNEMDDIHRNGAYIQRRKMYLQYPFHNLKSKVEIDWNSPSSQKNRLLERQASQKEYIKQIYERKVENRLKERYSNSLEMERDQGGRMRKLVEHNKDALEREVEEFNTSRLHNGNGEKNERKKSEDLQLKGQSQSAPSQSRQRQQDLHMIQKQMNYQGKEIPGQLDRSSSGQFYPNKQMQYDYYQKHNQNPQSYTPPLYPYSHQKQPAIYVPPAYGISPRSQRQQPYPSDLEYHQQQVFRKYGMYSQLPESYGGRPFKNAKPDELQGFLRQKSKVIDRKNTFDLHLSYVRPEKKK